MILSVNFELSVDLKPQEAANLLRRNVTERSPLRLKATDFDLEGDVDGGSFTVSRINRSYTRRIPTARIVGHIVAGNGGTSRVIGRITMNPITFALLFVASAVLIGLAISFAVHAPSPASGGLKFYHLLIMLVAVWVIMLVDFWIEVMRAKEILRVTFRSRANTGK